MDKNSQNFGIALTLLGGIFWGFSGACGQYLFERKGISAEYLTSLRLLLSGVIMLVILYVKSGKFIFSIFSSKKNIYDLLFYALFGIMACQYTYFVTIELSNAAIATILQYLAPVLVLFVLCIEEKRFPYKKESISVFCAIFGVFLLATHGNFASLVIPVKTLIIGIISACTIVIYTLSPRRLMRSYPVTLILAWAMVIGGIVLSLYAKPWQLKGISDFSGFLALCGVVVFGTIFAFSLYMQGVKILGGGKASVISAIEPVSAALFATFWLGSEFVFIDIVGFALIISAIILLRKG
ncbi:DMT family transporter [Campylobacter sp. RM16188]|uniref:EamA family transporter n=1 Tax=Campylobacter sp. RM16188 TaxID=1705725 RepID=UPI001556C450|nr:DMT family transporter [Campylobacter sp. RM16188]